MKNPPPWVTDTAAEWHPAHTHLVPPPHMAGYPPSPWSPRPPPCWAAAWLRWCCRSGRRYGEEWNRSGRDRRKEKGEMTLKRSRTSLLMEPRAKHDGTAGAKRKIRQALGFVYRMKLRSLLFSYNVKLLSDGNQAKCFYVFLKTLPWSVFFCQEKKTKARHAGEHASVSVHRPDLK